MLMGLYVENCKDPVGVDAYVYIYGDATDHTDNIYFGHQFNQTETVNGTSNSSSYRDVNSYTATVRRNASHVGFQVCMLSCKMFLPHYIAVVSCGILSATCMNARLLQTVHLSPSPSLLPSLPPSLLPSSCLCSFPSSLPPSLSLSLFLSL